jgi:hypothetical protein
VARTANMTVSPHSSVRAAVGGFLPVRLRTRLCKKPVTRSRRVLLESGHGRGGNIWMNRFVQWEERTQDTFLPSRLEDYVTDEILSEWLMCSSASSI